MAAPRPPTKRPRLVTLCGCNPFVSSSPIAAILVAVFVLEANFHPSQPRPILVVRIPAVAISVRAVILGPRSPIAPYRAVVPVHIASIFSIIQLVSFWPVWPILSLSLGRARQSLPI